MESISSIYIAIIYLKEQKVPIHAVDVQHYVEKTGKKIANMTVFMTGLEPENKRVQKLGRGLYIYECGI
jgi:hypothetical protein